MPVFKFLLELNVTLAPHKMVIGADTDFQGGGAGVLDRGAAILLIRSATSASRNPWTAR